MAGVLIGLSDLHYTKIISGATTPETAFAGEIKKLAKAIEAGITPNTSNAVLYADDGAAESASAEGETEISLTVDAIATAIYADLLGKETNADGVVMDSTGDVAPNVALAFRALKSNGKYRYFWYYKGTFQLPEESYQTKGESIEYNTPSINGVFVHSDIVKNAQGNGIKRMFVDEDDQGVNADVIANWFNAVYTGVTEEEETPEP
ncbi:major tail protein [Metasolibacillus meyeri]|uniref:major tail protein n=1 Tax=Metasolibacillus meyeri TaxID=1071052 RepID=UPI000D3126EC|nr:major tail protein [Metasolibacillus meyeri]